ncbi:MAG: N-acetyltransferase, partial [Candidatus Electrothrix sp. AUS4]|nr:N-acetyltransferase [Candidatus Electrothrix sp. AUS4]
MRILLDTNILIPLEDSSKALHDSFSEFARLAYSNDHCLLVHPGSRDDIERDRDITRREISLSRFKKYSLLSPPPAPPTEDELASYHLKQDDENDRVDNEILFSIFRNAANILVTEDRGLHRKANRMGLSDRVHYLQQAVAFLRRLHAVIPISLPNIEEVPL